VVGQGNPGDALTPGVPHLGPARLLALVPFHLNSSMLSYSEKKKKISYVNIMLVQLKDFIGQQNPSSGISFGQQNLSLRISMINRILF
jgi:hypothetical protein